MRLAIIGTGISGLTCAHLLHPHHDITVYEADARIGGHTNTVVISEGPDAGTAIDTGFIVCNDKTYPRYPQQQSNPLTRRYMLGDPGRKPSRNNGLQTNDEGY